MVGGEVGKGQLYEYERAEGAGQGVSAIEASLAPSPKTKTGAENT
jgi:hypothetical protein